MAVGEQDARYEVLVAVAYALVLPAIAVLHVRHAAVRGSGAVLGTIAGVSMVAVGIVAAVEPGVRSAALLILGMWWWTIGKTWIETGAAARPLGFLTAAFGALAILAALVLPLVAGAARADLPLWTVSHGVIGVWLIALAADLARTRTDVPSR